MLFEIFLTLVLSPSLIWTFSFLKILFILEWGEGRKRRRETSMCGCLLCTLYWGPDLAHNPGMCPHWELNWWPFGLQVGVQFTEPHQPGLYLYLLNLYWSSQFWQHSAVAPLCNTLFCMQCFVYRASRAQATPTTLRPPYHGPYAFTHDLRRQNLFQFQMLLS